MERNSWRHETVTVLMRRAQEGNVSALDALLVRLRPALLRYLVGRFARRWSTEAAEDVAQETLVRVAERLRSYRGATDGEVYAWAFAIARNFALATLRSTLPETLPAGDRVAVAAVHGTNEAAVDLLGDREFDRVAASTRMSRLVVQAYDTLPADAALLIWHRVIEGLAWADIAAEHATTPAAAKRRFQRMQQTIRRRVLARIAGYPAEDAVQLLAWVQHRCHH